MRRLSLWLFAIASTLPLAGCYYDPGYGYVRNGTGGDAYYGTETTTVVSPGYVDPGVGYYDYGPGCCYSGIGVGTVWYHDRYDRGGYYRDHDWHGRPPPGGWHGGPPGGWHGGDHRPPPGGWSGGDHRPPPGGWHGGGGGPPSGGWHGGDGGHRAPPPGGWHHDR